MPSNGHRLAIVKLYLNADHWQRIKQIARAEDRKAAGLLRNFVADGLARYEEERQSRPAA